MGVDYKIHGGKKSRYLFLIQWSHYLALCSYSTVCLNHYKIELSIKAKEISLLVKYVLSVFQFRFISVLLEVSNCNP